MAVLETSFLIDLLRGRTEAVAIFHQLQRNENALFVTTPTIMELWEGVLRSRMPDREKRRVEEFLAAATALPLDENAAKRAAEIDVELERKGTPIETADVMIAGIALTHGETVVTRDAHYTRVPGLNVLTYSLKRTE